MLISRRLITVLLGALALGLLAGCGSSSSSSSAAKTTNAGPTKAEFVAQANAICAAAAPQTGKLLGEVQSATTAALTSPSPAGVSKLAAMVGKLHDGASTVLAKLEALPRPAAGAGSIQLFITPLSQAIAGLGKAVKELQAGSATKAVSSLLKLQASTPQLAGAARVYGLTQCGGVLSGTSG